MIIFSGINLEDYILVQDVGGRGPITVGNTHQSIPGRDGSITVGQALKSRMLWVKFAVKGESLVDLRQRVDVLNGLLYTTEDVPIQFTDEPGKTYYGRLDGSTDWEEIIYIGKGVFYLHCSDSLKYGSEMNAAFANDTVNLNVGGNYKTFPKFAVTFTAAASEFKFTHPSGKYVRLIRNFIAGDELEVDFKTGKITLNGSLSMPILDWANSQFFELTPGSQTLTVTPAAVASVNIYWQSRWL